MRYLAATATTGNMVVKSVEQDVSLSVLVEPAVVYEGDAIAVTGMLSGALSGLPIPGRMVQIRLFADGDISETPVASGTPQTDSDGFFAQFFVLPAIGDYRARASFSATDYRETTALSGIIRVVERPPGVAEIGYYALWLQILSRSSPVCKCPVGGELIIKPALGEPCENYMCPTHNARLEVVYVPPKPPVGEEADARRI